ncbi:MAG: hypothetical protein CMC15_18190 [Flavobacteriaceae bacterium]|nr:hypothetical protein [Flavobacteriaceae bacterium]
MRTRRWGVVSKSYIEKSDGRSVFELTTSEIFIFKDRYNRRTVRSIFLNTTLNNRCRLPNAAHPVSRKVSAQLSERFLRRFWAISSSLEPRFYN